MTTGYDLGFYGELLTCAPRTPAYVEALRRTVTSNSVVIDLGAGPGFFALLALQFGARSVIAIEPDASVEILRGLAAAQGLSDRLTIFRGLSTMYQPVEKADIIISDLRGVLPLFESFAESIADARRRLLSSTGIFLPARDVLSIALVEAADEYSRFCGPWVDDFHGVDLSSIRVAGLNAQRRVWLEPSALLSEPAILARIDYRYIDGPDLSAHVTLRPKRHGTVHGFAIWFDAEMDVDGLNFSNSPLCPAQVYGQMFFPFEQPIEATDGSEFSIDVSALYSVDGYIWSWSTKANLPGRPTVKFRQSNFVGAIPDPDRIRRQQPTYVPMDSRQRIDAQALFLFDGKRSLGEVAEDLMDRFPGSFRNLSHAVCHLAKLSARYEDDLA